MFSTAFISFLALSSDFRLLINDFFFALRELLGLLVLRILLELRRFELLPLELRRFFDELRLEALLFFFDELLSVFFEDVTAGGVISSSVDAFIGVKFLDARDKRID
jgi:hypothetical protein